MLRGDLVAALDLNALYVIALPVVVAGLAWWLARGRVTPVVPGRGARWAAVTVVAAFFVVRNLPWAPFTVLAS